MVRYYAVDVTLKKVIKYKNNMENHVKISFIHDAFGDESIERAWAIKVENGYQLDNILFYAKDFSFGDIVSVIESNGELLVSSLIEENGHSTLRVLLANEEMVPFVREELKHYGCSTELSNMKNLIAVDIPPNVSYKEIREYLDKGEVEEKWEYQEACIASNHQD